MKVISVERIKSLIQGRLRSLERAESNSNRFVSRERFINRLKVEISLLEAILRNEKQFDMDDIKPRNFVLNAFAQGGLVDMDYAGIEIRTVAQHLPQTTISALNEQIKAKDKKIEELTGEVDHLVMSVNSYQRLYFETQDELTRTTRLLNEQKNRNKDIKALEKDLDYTKQDAARAKHWAEKANKRYNQVMEENLVIIQDRDTWKKEAQRLEKLVQAPKKQSVLDLFVGIVHDDAEVEKLKKKVDQQAERIIVQTEELAAHRHALKFEGSDKLEIIRLDAERRKAWRLYFYFKSILDKLGIKY